MREGGDAPRFSLAHAQTGMKRSTISHYHIPATANTVHWGYFSKSLSPLVEVESGDFATIETLTHHAGDVHHGRPVRVWQGQAQPLEAA